jgi:hypothetical protein
MICQPHEQESRAVGLCSTVASVTAPSRSRVTGRLGLSVFRHTAPAFTKSALVTAALTARPLALAASVNLLDL